MLIKNFFIVFALLVSSCSLDFVRSSEIPSEMPEDVVMRYTEDHGMSPSWFNIEVTAASIVVRTKKARDEKETVEYSNIAASESASLFDVFRENKFDLLENLQNEDIVYDAGGDALSLRVEKNSYRASSGENSPLSSAHQRRYDTISSAIRTLAKKHKSKLSLLPDNLVTLNYQKNLHKFVEPESIRAVLAPSTTAKVYEIASRAFNETKKANDQLFSEYRIQLIPYKDSSGSLFVWTNVVCSSDAISSNWTRLVVDTTEKPECRLQFLITPSADSYKALLSE